MAEAFGAAVTALAVVVALWQSVILRLQAKEEGVEASNRLRQELEAAQSRHTAELEAAEKRHRAELQSQKESAREQVEAQKEIARVQRLHLREQEFKQAVIRVGRAANAYTHELATLIETGRRAAELSTKREREDALLTNSKQLGILAQDINNEISGAHMLTRDDALHDVLNEVNAASLAGPYAEMQYRNPIINEGNAPPPIGIFQAMDGIQVAMGRARQLAGDLLQTGWD